MIQNQQQGEVSLIGVSGAQSMKMNLNGKAFSALIDQLYTDKAGAVIRELCANARDAMVMAGKKGESFEVFLPNELNHELVIRDEGVGLSKENVAKYLGTLFESSKDNENESIGTYGLGSKSPFCVTDSYIVESRFNGEKHIFNWFRVPGGVPDFLHIGTQPTDEPNGITFKIPSGPAMYRAYEEALAAQLFFFDPKPVVYGAMGDSVDPWKEYGEVSLEFDNGNIKIVKSQGMVARYGQIAAEMGGILYPIKQALLKLNPEDDLFEEDETMMARFHAVTEDWSSVSIQAMGLRANNSCLVISFPIGSISIPPSRESVEYGQMTNLVIMEKMLKAQEEIAANWAEQVKKQIDDLIASKPDTTQGNALVDEICLQLKKSNEIIAFHGSRLKPYKALTWTIPVFSGLDWIGQEGGAIKKEVEVSHINFGQKLALTAIELPHKKEDRIDKSETVFYFNSHEKQMMSELGITAKDIEEQIHRLWNASRLVATDMATQVANINAALKYQGYTNFYELRRFEEHVRQMIRDKDRIGVSVSENRIRVSFERDFVHYEPKLKTSGDIVPTGDVMTCLQPSFGRLKEVNVFYDSWDRGTGRKHPYGNVPCYIIEDRELEQRDRRAGFFLRSKVLEKRHGIPFDQMTDDQKEEIYDIPVSHFDSHFKATSVCWIKYEDEQDIEHFKEALKHTWAAEAIFYKASEIPKVWMRKGAINASTMRGVRCYDLSIRFSQEKGRVDRGEIDYLEKKNLRATGVDFPYSRDSMDFVALQEGKPLEAGIITYTDGETSRLYIDPEFRKEFRIEEMQRAAVLFRLMDKEFVRNLKKQFKGKERFNNVGSWYDFSINSHTRIYRISPSAQKHVDTLKQHGSITIDLASIRDKNYKPMWSKLTKTLRSAMARSLTYYAASDSNIMNLDEKSRAVLDVKCLKKFEKFFEAVRCGDYAQPSDITSNDWIVRHVLHFRPLSLFDFHAMIPRHGNPFSTGMRISIAKHLEDTINEFCLENAKKVCREFSIDDRSSKYFDIAFEKLIAD